MTVEMANVQTERLERLGLFEMKYFKDNKVTKDMAYEWLIQTDPESFTETIQKFMNFSDEEFEKNFLIIKIGLRMAVRQLEQKQRMNTLKGLLRV